jgi:hypothetical protein
MHGFTIISLAKMYEKCATILQIKRNNKVTNEGISIRGILRRKTIFAVLEM